MTPHEAAQLVQVRQAVASGRALQIRRDARLKAAEMASLVMVPPPTLAAWEAGRRMPTGPAALRYAKALARLEEQLPAAAVAAS